MIHSRSSVDLLHRLNAYVMQHGRPRGTQFWKKEKRNLLKNRTLHRVSQVQRFSCSFTARTAKAFLWHFRSNGAVVTHIRDSRWDATGLYSRSLCLFVYFFHALFPEAFAPTDLLLQGLRLGLKPTVYTCHVLTDSYISYCHHQPSSTSAQLLVLRFFVFFLKSREKKHSFIQQRN